MSHWVTCKVLGNPEIVTHFNLDQVVSMTDTENGVRIICSEAQTKFFVEGKAFDILVSAGIVPST